MEEQNKPVEPKPDYSKLTHSEFAKKEAEFLSYTKQVARADRLARIEKARAASPDPQDLSTLTDAEFERAERKFLRRLW